MKAMVTSAQREQLEREGFFVLEGVFTRMEMANLSRLIDAHHQRTKVWVRDHSDQSGISRPDEIIFTCHLAEQDPVIREFCLQPKLVQLTTELVGADVDLYWNQSVFKEPETPREFPWHQDDGYTPVTPSPYITLWLALNDATLENGCISVLPGRHKLGLLPHHESSLGWVCHEADDPDQGICVPVSSGSMVVMYSLVPHKSGPNLSAGARNAFILQYCSSDTRHADPGKSLEERIPVARGGKAVPIKWIDVAQAQERYKRSEATSSSVG
jgi:ectoine hydroxylase-related dioxygenase (phytanoyl-CoA dioxygenase family)